MKIYNSFSEIEKDLKKLQLEKEIAIEELKIVKHDFEAYTKPIVWVNKALKYLSKYGVLLMIKKLFK
jgi:hypothetical protein